MSIKYEPIIVARKPVDGSIVENVMKYGVGGINIDECRVPLEDDYKQKTTTRKQRQDGNVFDTNSCGFDSESNSNASANPNGRFPANVIHDNSEEATNGFPYTKSTGGSGEASRVNTFKNVTIGAKANTGSHLGGLGDEGSASRYFKSCEFSIKDADEYYDEPKRFFYGAKANKQDRDEGISRLEEYELKSDTDETIKNHILSLLN